MRIQLAWNVKTKVIPVGTGVTETTLKTFRQYVSNILRKHDIKKLQNTAMLVIAHLLREVLMYSTSTKRFIMANNITSAIN